MKKYINRILILIMVLILASACKIYAASTGLSASKTTINVGETSTITATISATETWSLNMSTSGGSLSGTTSSTDAAGAEVSKQVMSATFKPTTSGTYTVKLNGVIAGSDLKKQDVSKSVTITVKEKEAPAPATTTEQKPTTNTNTNTNTNKNTNTNTNANTNKTKPQEPSFTSTNQTVYATSEVNVRSSYSTSSSSVGSIKKGDSVIRIGVGSNGWSKVKYNGTTAYINSNYLTTTKPEEEKKEEKPEEKQEEKSTDKALKSLEITEGILTPEFDPETTQYEIFVETDVEKLEIKATPNSEKAKVSIQGNENLKAGENSIKIIVTAEDETARTYNIVVKKSDKEALGLATLKIDGITLTPKFSTDVYEYKADLTTNLDKLNIIAKSNNEKAEIEILGNENLKIGENIITIMLKSEDGTKTATYQILVDKKEIVPVEQLNSTEEKSGFFSEFGTEQMIIIGIGVLCVIIIITIILIIRKMIKEKHEDDIEFNFMDDIKNNNEEKNNYNENIESNKFNFNEEISSIEENRNDSNEHRLYNVENEPDFKKDDIEEETKTKRRGKRKGKHF